MPDAEIIAPQGYSLWWGVLGLVLVALVVAGWIVLWRLTRAPRSAADGTTAPEPVLASTGPGDPWAGPRSVALGLIDELAAGHREGTVPGRQVHQGLSVIVRDFTTARTGLDASTLTLTELQHHRDAAPASALIEKLYSPEFAAGAEGDPVAAIEQTREVVGRW